MTEDEREELARRIQTALIADRPTYMGDASVAGPASHLAWTAMEVAEAYLAEREQALRDRLADDVLRLPLMGEYPVLRLASDVVRGKYNLGTRS
jgi:hypothetical protein